MIVAFEGIDGAGKTTLGEWLLVEINKYIPAEFCLTCWNSFLNYQEEELADKFLKPRKVKMRHEMSPLASCLWHCADFMQRCASDVFPASKSGQGVLMDRYIYTAYVRDGLRGIDPTYVENIYRYAPKPDLLIYLDADPVVAAERKSGYGFYESGEDFLQLPDSAATRKDFFIKFQGMCRQRYLEVLPDYAIHVDGNAPQEEVRQKVLAIVLDKWRELKADPPISRQG